MLNYALIEDEEDGDGDVNMGGTGSGSGARGPDAARNASYAADLLYEC